MNAGFGNISDISISNVNISDNNITRYDPISNLKILNDKVFLAAVKQAMSEKKITNKSVGLFAINGTQGNELMPVVAEALKNGGYSVSNTGTSFAEDTELKTGFSFGEDKEQLFIRPYQS